MYELEGVLDGKRYEIEVTRSGEVIEVDREDEADDEADDDGPDHDEDDD